MFSDDYLRETEWTNEKKKKKEGEDQRLGEDSIRPERSFAHCHGAPDLSCPFLRRCSVAS